MLPFDALLKRMSLAVIVGIVASVWVSPKWSVFVGVVVLYVLLIVHTKPVNKWPLE